MWRFWYDLEHTVPWDLLCQSYGHSPQTDQDKDNSICLIETEERGITWWRLKRAFRFTRRPTSPGARNGLLSPGGGHSTHDHQLRHLLHTPEVRLGNTFWTKQMWAVVFCRMTYFLINTENIFSGGCEVYEGMIGNQPAEDQALLDWAEMLEVEEQDTRLQ